jgi:CheY-like chemotaxis protein
MGLSAPLVGARHCRLVMPPSVTHSPAPPTTGVDARILVVEDHPVNRRVAEMMLSPFGFKLGFAENGLVAVQTCAREGFDLVLMDLQMPVMDGLTAIRQIRARESGLALGRTAIAMLSANIGQDYEMQARLAGADSYIAKPLRLGTLLGGIAQALQAARRFGEPPAHALTA